MIAGRYELEREIGRGGAGVVWLAHDRLLDRQVALKQVGRAPGSMDVDDERAAREARLSASIQHRNIVAVFDLAVDDGTGEQWLVMEYVAGATLSQVVRERGPMPPVQAAHVMGQVADALAAAHLAGITHRDVKPSNILLERDGTAKLTDFGIARTLSDPQLTQTGMLSGSPAYLAPEVASGQRADMTADVWSWGATLFHLLAGHPPYDMGDNVIGGLYRVVHDEPPRLADAGPLAPVLEGTMVKDTAQRWPMTRVRDELAGLDPDGAEGAEGAEGQTLVMSAVPAPPSQPPASPAATAVLPTPPGPTAAGARAARADAETAPWWRRPAVVVGAIAAAVLLLVLALTALLGGGGGGGTSSADSRRTAAPPTRSSSSPKPPASPTVAGMRLFIQDYVRTVAADPSQSWQMLTPEFQRESGGFARYSSFWDPATNGTVTDIQADPTTLRVTYRPHFDDWRNSDNPTILDLAFREGRYLIAAEHTAGFVPVTTPPHPPHGNGHPGGHGKAPGGHGKAKGHYKK
ncbi:MAG: serine/threonine protein kinase [Nocardioidaceae bacterium]|nr:serine/threonine protein kinase [Nocardioidaceae bacterium]